MADIGRLARASWLALPMLLQGCFIFDFLGTPVATTTGDTAPHDTGPGRPRRDTGPPTECLQQDAVDNGQVELLEAEVVVEPSTLAVRTPLPPPSAPLPGSLADTDHHGAVDAAGVPWWSGWTFVNPSSDGGLPGAHFHPLEAEVLAGDLAPAAVSRCTDMGLVDGGRADLFGVGFPVCVIRDGFLTDATLTPDHLYVLAGQIKVGNGDRSGLEAARARVTLTIQAGAQVFGDSSSRSGLVITRGSEVRVRGTADRPVILAAVAADYDRADVIVDDPAYLLSRGLWQGLVLSGQGVVNPAPEIAVNSIGGTRFFGGDVDADRSADIDYLIIAEAGQRGFGGTAPLELEAAGRGTTVDHVQILGSESDCVNVVGGAAFLRHFVCSGFERAGVAMALGYTGEVQWGLIVMGEANGYVGIQGSNNPGRVDAKPATAPRMANLTVLGGRGSGGGTRGAIYEKGWRGEVHRSIFADAPGSLFQGGCLDIDDVLPEELRYVETVFSCQAGALSPCPDDW